MWNRGKESVVADLDDVAGQDEVRALIAGADVVIEAFDAGRADAWGLGYDHARRRASRSRLLLDQGVRADGAVRRRQGVRRRRGGQGGRPRRKAFGFRDGPIFSGSLVASNGAAHMAASGILAALIVRDRTGRGQRVDASLYQGLNPIDYFVSYHVQMGARAAAASSSATAAGAGGTGVDALHGDVVHPGRALDRVQPAAAAPGGRPRAGVLGLDAMFDDDRFKTMPVVRHARGR